MRTLLLLAALAAPAAADPAAKAAAPSTTTDVKAMHTDDCAKAHAKNKACVIDMGKGDDIEGGIQTPGGTGVVAIPTGKNASLIHIRKDFIVEILKSAEDLD